MDTEIGDKRMNTQYPKELVTPDNWNTTKEVVETFKAPQQEKSVDEMLKQIANLGNLLSHLDQAMSALSLDILSTKYQLKAIFETLVDKKLLTEDELNSLLTSKVAEPMEQHIKNIQKRMEDIVKKNSTQNEKEETKNSEKQEEEIENKVVLASERFKKGGD